MFTEKTVLVLGAGASKRLGYPTGDELLSNIKYTIENGTFYSRYEGEKFYDIPASRRLLEALRASSPSSIDSFLTDHTNDQELINEGKFFIAYEILKCEDVDKFNEEKSDWYPFLRDKTIKYCRDISELKSSLDHLNIITFNYDVSLEYRLHSLFTLNGRIFPPEVKERDELLTQLNSRIIHVYGKVGWFSWQEKDSLRKNNGYGRLVPEYGRHKDWPNDFADKMKAYISVVGEERENLPHIQEARKQLENANIIYFLGFGFDEDNINRLDLKNTTRRAKRIYCTNFNNTPKINKAISNTFSKKISATMGNGEHFYSDRPSNDVEVAVCSVYDALRDHFPF